MFLAVSALAALAAGSWRSAAADMERAPDPVILGTEVDLKRAVMTITGLNLGSAAAPPAVTLGGRTLRVTEVTTGGVIAELPDDVTAGTQLLVVARDGRSDRLAATIPSSTFVTPEGVLLESTGGEVRIKAGTSTVTVTQTGGIVISSTGALTVSATGALNLQGRSVSIISDTTLNLWSGTSTGLTAGTSVAADAAGSVTVRGATISLN
jgi:hypothetical protein